MEEKSIKSGTTIPLPNELPPKLMPESLDHLDGSQAIEMAVVQNTDLMNRLSLALKRTAHLEARLNFSERNSHQRKEKLSVLDDEIQILRSNQNQVHFQLKKMSATLTESEKKYASLYQVYLKDKENLKYYQKQIEHFKGLSTNLRTQSQEDLISLVDYHEKRYTDIHKSWEDLNEKLRIQKQKISDIESQKMEVHKQLSLNQNQVQSYKQSIKSLQEEFSGKLKHTLDTVAHHQKQIQEKDTKIIQLETQASQLKTYQAELEKVQKERDRLKIRLQSKEIEYQEIKEVLSKSEQKDELSFSKAHELLL